MNQTGYYVRVGIAMAFGVVLLFASISLLRGTLTDFRSMSFDVDFHNAQGITPGAAVQMAGIQIGRITEVKLVSPDTARLHLRIDRQYRIPRGSHFRIPPGLLANTPLVSIVPPANASAGYIVENETGLRGEDAADLTMAFAKANVLMDKTAKILDSVQVTALAAQKLATDPSTQRDLKATLANVRDATENLPGLTATMQQQLLALSGQTKRLLAQMDTTLLNGNKVVANAGNLTGDMRATLAENRSNLKSLIANTDATASAFRGLTEQLTDTVKGGKLKENLAETTDNLRSLTTRLDTIAGNLERLSSDPRLNSDIRETVSNLKETSASVRVLAGKLENARLPGGSRGPAKPRTRELTTLLEPGVVVDSLYNGRDERLRFDTNYTLLGSGGQFYRVGLVDFSEGNHLNLQMGRTQGLPEGMAIRYGLVAGKIGGGLDLGGGPLTLRLDAYDPNRVILNVRGKARLSDTVSGLFGVDHVGRDHRIMVGAQIRQ